MISLVNIIFEVGHGGNFLTHTLATEYLNCVGRKLKPELVNHNEDNNEYLKTCFHPIIDRSHVHHLDPNEFEKLRDSKCVVITSSPEVYNKIFNMGIWKNRFRKNIKQKLGYIDDTTEQFNEYIMVSLRTIWGCNQDVIELRFSPFLVRFFKLSIKKWLKNGEIEQKATIFILTQKGKIIADRITSDLFYVD